MTTDARAHLLELLATKHVGHDHGIDGEALAVAIGIPPRELRDMVSELREEGLAVCAHPGTGYFIAANADELETYCIKFLRSRALHSLRLISRLTNTALPTLVGQLPLES